MENRFDGLAKILAGGVNRRDVMKWFGGGAGATVIRWLGLGTVGSLATITATPASASTTCVTFCAQFPQSERAQCLSACAQCGGNTNRLCGSPGAFTCCSTGTFCCGCACCPSSNACCNGTCTDLKSDANNCGTCGTVCVDEICKNGTCAACPSGSVFCGSTCTSLATDPNNCGACGTVCSF